METLSVKTTLQCKQTVRCRKFTALRYLSMPHACRLRTPSCHTCTPMNMSERHAPHPNHIPRMPYHAHPEKHSIGPQSSQCSQHAISMLHNDTITNEHTHDHHGLQTYFHATNALAHTITTTHTTMMRQQHHQSPVQMIPDEPCHNARDRAYSPTNEPCTHQRTLHPKSLRTRPPFTERIALINGMHYQHTSPCSM